MPNYQKTLIYKLICNNANITQFYVGHTTNFNKRKSSHKSCCNEKSKQYNKDKYKFICDNGGWNNWNMIEIEKYPCNNIKEALIRERYWIEILNSKLNKNIPTRTTKEWRMENKDKVKEYYKKSYDNNRNKIIEKKNKYQKEYNKINSDKINEKRREKITCECGCILANRNISRHLKSQKHIDLIANKN